MIKVAIMGHGTVGSGVYEVFDMNADKIAKTVGEPVEVKYVLDLRDFSSLPYGNKFVTDFSVIENDPEVTVVAEVMGGVGAAYQFTKRCLEAGKSVCTSNKELVATKGEELLKIAEEHGVNYMFEASVGGGIPVIRPMLQCLAANEFNEILRHPERHDQLHSHPDDPQRCYLCGCAQAGTAQRLCREGSDR